MTFSTESKIVNSKSVLVGMELKVIGYRMLDLATGSLLHDIGKAMIPKAILNKKDELLEDEKKIIRSHAVLSYKIILKELRYSVEQAKIGLYHHEKWNGKGYPRGLSGEKIPFLARIVSVADTYTALVDKRPYRDRQIGYNAVKIITGDNGKHYDPRITKSLLNAVGLHPIGSIVQLNNNVIGMVVSANPELPLRPRIEVLVDEFGDRIKGEKFLDLQELADLYITKPLSKAYLKQKFNE